MAATRSNADALGPVRQFSELFGGPRQLAAQVNALTEAGYPPFIVECEKGSEIRTPMA